MIMERKRRLLPDGVMIKRAITDIEEQVEQRVGVRMLRPGPHLHGEQTQPHERKRPNEAWQRKEETLVEGRGTHYA